QCQNRLQVAAPLRSRWRAGADGSAPQTKAIAAAVFAGGGGAGRGTAPAISDLVWTQTAPPAAGFRSSAGAGSEHLHGDPAASEPAHCPGDRGYPAVAALRSGSAQ